MNQITSWPLPKDDENFDSRPFKLDWTLYADYVPWIRGKIYRALKEVATGGFLPRKKINNMGRFEFTYSITTIMEDHLVTREEALRKNHTSPIKAGEFFMLIDDHFDGFIFSVLYLDKVRYVSRQGLNLDRSVEIVYGKTKI